MGLLMRRKGMRVFVRASAGAFLAFGLVLSIPLVCPLLPSAS